MMRAGFGRVDVTPPLGTPMAGYFYTRKAEGVFDPLQLNAVVMESDGEQIAVITADFLDLFEREATRFRVLIEKATGIPAERVLIQCLHQHTSVSVGEMTPHFMAVLAGKFTDVVLLALDDLAECTLSAAEKETAEPVSFIRRYRMKDGSTRTNPGFLNPEIDHPLGEADNTVRLVRFHRQDRGDIAMVAFQTHPDTIAGSRFSADWPGFVRRNTERALEKEAVHCILVNGCQGDTNHFDLSRPRPTKIPEERYQVLTPVIAKVISDTALSLWNEGKALPEGPVSGEVTVHSIPSNLNGIERVEECKALQELILAKKPTPKPLSMEEMGEIRRISAMDSLPLFQKVPVTLVAVGKLCFVGYGGEPFTEYATVLREAYPDLLILTCCQCNGAQGYLPSLSAFEDGGYEARTTNFTPGTPALLQGEAKAKLGRHAAKLK